MDHLTEVLARTKDSSSFVYFLNKAPCKHGRGGRWLVAEHGRAHGGSQCDVPDIKKLTTYLFLDFVS